MKPKPRSIAVGTLGVVAVVSLFLSTASIWVHTVLFDTDRVAESVGDSLSRPEVSEGLADFVTAQIFELVQAERRASDLVPDGLEPLLPMVQEAAERRVSDRIEQFIVSDRGRSVVVEAARVSHRAALAALDGDPLPDGVAVDEDTVSLNLLPLLFQGLTIAAETGIVAEAAVPELTPQGSVTGQIRQLELAFQVDLPEDFGQFVLYEGDKVAQGHEVLDIARRSVTYFNRAIVMVVLLTVVSAAATIGFARRRGRAVGLLALGAALVLLAQRVLVDAVVDQTSDLLLDPAARSLVSAVVTALTSSLLTAITVIVWVSVAVAFAVAAAGAVTRRRPIS